ncbi:MAG: TonB-dependent receptor plug domain-containing protein [Flavobacteriaceae bacterium]|jgi:outer membrane cobalamin receptor|nr:TonB-dependent receptor plug domain-containing protein [Flavobacteriaceae bacterium]
MDLKKVLVCGLLVLFSATSVYAQQKTGKGIDSTDVNEIQEIVLTGGVADIAKDRKTPVAVSNIKEAQIVRRLGNQEFPEILNTTPSIYATKGGGGFGDGRVNVRGFDTNNVAVMLNGIPVNDMEAGTVYWSNWQGLSDVTSVLQIQRGLGASKLAIASVGGTINIVTRSADMKKEGNVTVGLGNDGYIKSLFSYNSGLSINGWSVSFLMSRTSGATYIDGSDFEGYNYYFALGYKPNSKHDFQFTFTGAPQWHMQNYQSSIATYLKYGKDGEPNRRYNSNWGYLNGKEYSQGVNYYSKPIMSLNWDWSMSESSKLSTVAYASWGRGGGTGILGSINGTNINNLPKTEDGLIRFDDIYTWNTGGSVADFGADNQTPYDGNSKNGIIRRSNINSHDWYGFLTNFQHKINDKLEFSVGLDGRYYYGYHPSIVTDFLGNAQYLEKGDLNRPNGYWVTGSQNAAPSANPFAKAVDNKSQIVNRNYDGEVTWGGVFGQLEYSDDVISAFLQGSISNQWFQRIDHWIVDGVTEQIGQTVNEKTGFKSIRGFNAKTGINYNIDQHNNVFINGGYYSKQPNNYTVYPNYQQVLNPELTNEKIVSVEAGYGFRSDKFKANLNLYYTSWNDRYVYKTLSIKELDEQGVDNLNDLYNPFANYTGVHEIHMGAEFDAVYNVTDWLDLNAMFSYGDWKYNGNADYQAFNGADNTFITKDGVPFTGKLDLDGVKVSDAAQTTAALGFNLKPVKDFNIFATWTYDGRLYSQFAVTNAVNLKLPDYNLFDLGASYTFRFSEGQKLILTANVYNLLDTIYISDGKSSNLTKTLNDFGGSQADYDNYLKNNTWKGIDTSNTVYFGFGRTWSASVSFRF